MITTVLIIGIEKVEFNYFEDFFSSKELMFSYCEEYTEAIKIIEYDEVDLVICNTQLNADTSFKVYEDLYPFLKKNNIPIFLIIDKQNINLVNLALEMGIDNLIFRPFNLPIIERKIRNQLRKTSSLTIHKNENFLSFFNYNLNPMLIIKAGKIKSYNHAFSELVYNGTIESDNKKLWQIFQFEHDPVKYHQFKRLESGLISQCVIEKVQLAGLKNEIFDILLVKDLEGSVIVQVNPSKSRSLKEFDNPKNKRKSGDHPSGISNNFKLTKREMDIYNLSAKGLPIKIIAEELNLSPRTVEKHRANIMEKLGAKNMIEVVSKF